MSNDPKPAAVDWQPDWEAIWLKENQLVEYHRQLMQWLAPQLSRAAQERPRCVIHGDMWCTCKEIAGSVVSLRERAEDAESRIAELKRTRDAHWGAYCGAEARLKASLERERVAQDHREREYARAEAAEKERDEALACLLTVQDERNVAIRKLEEVTVKRDAMRPVIETMRAQIVEVANRLYAGMRETLHSEKNLRLIMDQCCIRLFEIVNESRAATEQKERIDGY
jgi:hypothetical protein